MGLDFLCRWQVQASVYCAWQIPAHLRCTQCSILLHLMDIFFLTCNSFVCGCLTCICLDITRFYEEQHQSSSGSAWQACPKNRGPIAGVGGFNTIGTAVWICYDSSTACRLCRMEPNNLDNETYHISFEADLD